MELLEYLTKSINDLHRNPRGMKEVINELNDEMSKQGFTLQFTGKDSSMYVGVKEAVEEFSRDEWYKWLTKLEKLRDSHPRSTNAREVITTTHCILIGPSQYPRMKKICPHPFLVSIFGMMKTCNKWFAFDKYTDTVYILDHLYYMKPEPGAQFGTKITWNR